MRRRSDDESEYDYRDWFTLFPDMFDVNRAVKMNLANEGLEAKKKEEEVLAKKRKAEEDANWEGS